MSGPWVSADLPEQQWQHTVPAVPMPGTRGVSVLPEELMAPGSTEQPVDTQPTLAQHGSAGQS